MTRVSVSKITDCLRELADKDFQRKVWLASSGPKISSLEEAVCGLYDDSGLQGEMDRAHTVFSETIDGKLAVLGNKLLAIDSYRHPSEIIEDPKMDEVRMLAAELLNVISDEGIL
jgi:hypothetical protein